MKTRSILLALTLAATAAAPAVAQGRVSLEPRLGVALPQGDDGDEIDAGVSASLNVLYAINDRFTAYAGYNLNRFDESLEDFCEGDPACEELDVTLDIKGLTAGVRAGFPMRGAAPFVQAGLVYQRLAARIDGEGGSIGFDSDDELGFEAGGGVDIPVSARISVVPAVSYTKVEDVEYVKVDAGVRIRL